MTSSDIMRSVQVAIYDEKRRLTENREFFNEEEYTLVVTSKALDLIVSSVRNIMTCRVSGDFKLFGFNVKVTYGEEIKMYLAKEIELVSYSDFEGGATWPNP